MTQRAQDLVDWKPGLARGVVVRRDGSPTGFAQGNRALVEPGEAITWESVLRGRE